MISFCCFLNGIVQNHKMLKGQWKLFGWLTRNLWRHTTNAFSYFLCWRRAFLYASPDDECYLTFSLFLTFLFVFVCFCYAGVTEVEKNMELCTMLWLIGNQSHYSEVTATISVYREGIFEFSFKNWNKITLNNLLAVHVSKQTPPLLRWDYGWN